MPRHDMVRPGDTAGDQSKQVREKEEEEGEEKEEE